MIRASRPVKARRCESWCRGSKYRRSILCRRRKLRCSVLHRRCELRHSVLYRRGELWHSILSRRCKLRCSVLRGRCELRYSVVRCVIHGCLHSPKYVSKPLCHNKTAKFTRSKNGKDSCSEYTCRDSAIYSDSQHNYTRSYKFCQVVKWNNMIFGELHMAVNNIFLESGRWGSKPKDVGRIEDL